MKKTLSLLAVLMAAGVATTPVQAATHYVSGFGGVSWMQNVETRLVLLTPAPINFTYGMGTGLAFTGAVGCDYGNYRIEGEAGYQTSNIKTFTASRDGVVVPQDGPAGPETATSSDLNGVMSAYTLMANGYYDFDLGSKVELYATAGVGVAQVYAHDVHTTGSYSESAPYTFIADPTSLGISDHATTLAWQVGAGIAAPISDHVKLDLRYRYFATTDFDVLAILSRNISTHSALLGLRVDF